MLIETDWDNQPRKYCFAACPADVLCECRDRIEHEEWNRKWVKAPRCKKEPIDLKEFVKDLDGIEECHNTRGSEF